MAPFTRESDLMPYKDVHLHCKVINNILLNSWFPGCVAELFTLKVPSMSTLQCAVPPMVYGEINLAPVIIVCFCTDVLRLLLQQHPL